MSRKITDLDITIAKNIHRLRKERGLTLAQVGECLGVTFQQVQKYEFKYENKNRICASKLFKLADLFKVKMEEFIKDVQK